MNYTALIRTHDSLPLLDTVVNALRAQTAAPACILAVDSASSGEQRRALSRLVDEVIDYPPEVFNFSKAINLGVARCRTPWVLVISSHVVLEDPDTIARAIADAQAADCWCFYLFAWPMAPWTRQVISRANFDGRNGLSNTCAFLPTQAVLARPFREEVFSAEDQEWAAHHFNTSDVRILRIGTDRLKYLNARANEMKYINEEISIAYFARRQNMGWGHLLGWLLRAAIYFAAGRRRRARTYLTIFTELLRARRRPPVRVSRYF